MNDSDIEFIAEEEITQAAIPQGTSWTTPEVNLNVVPRDNQSKRKEKNKKEELWKWTKKVKVTKQEECHLVPEIQRNLNETVYAQSEWKKLHSYQGELKALLGINFDMAINTLPTIAEYWRIDNLIGNDGIQNAMIRNRSCEILQNLHFAVNRKDDKRDKAFKMRPVIDHLNSKFSEVLSNDSEQSIDEHMVKFKGRSGMKQYIKSKPIK